MIPVATTFDLRGAEELMEKLRAAAESHHAQFEFHVVTNGDVFWINATWQNSVVTRWEALDVLGEFLAQVDRSG